MQKLKINISGLFIVVLLLMVSCQPSQSDLEIEVINDILPELLSEYSDLAPLRYKRGTRTLLIDTSRFSPMLDLMGLEPEKMSADRFESLIGIDTTWQKLVSKINDPQLTSEAIDITRVKLDGYEIESVIVDERFKKQELVGVVSFSNTVFNSDRSRACVFYTFACSAECNVGYYIFVERTAIGWKIVQATNLWVS